MTTHITMGMATLFELAVREAEISAQVAHAGGVMDAKEAALASSGVFAAYTDVLAVYVSLFGSQDAGAEALARAAFLVWYEVAEPACFSGLRDLPGVKRHRGLTPWRHQEVTPEGVRGASAARLVRAVDAGAGDATLPAARSPARRFSRSR